MARSFLTEDAKKALGAAIESIEAVSSAEIVVAVRARSGSYLHVSVIVGVVAAFATLAFTLYSDYEFSLLAILVDPLVAGIVLGLAAIPIAPLKRWLTPPAIRRRWVRTAAQAAFFARGIRHTSDRTGVLVYLSLTERMAELVADTGVTTAVAEDQWRACAGRIDSVIAGGGDGAAVAIALGGLGDVLGPALPRRADDINELPDEVYSA